MPTAAPTRTVYHETLWDAVKASLDEVPALHAVDLGAASTASPMSYEGTQTLRLPLTPDDRLQRRARRSVLAVSIYRMPSGRYEVTAYAA